MTRKQKKRLYRIISGFVVFIIANLLPDLGIVNLGVFLIAYVIAGGDVVIKAVKNIARGQLFDENFLMSIATIGAFFVGENPEGVAVMLFYQVGELFQSYAVAKSRKSIQGLMDIRPDYANCEKDGQIISVDPEEVKIGDIIVVKPGEKIPLDGKVIKGETSVDTSALTGESVPRKIHQGDEILSGCINISGLIYILVSKEFGESTVAKILDLVENASNKKASTENFITKFSRYYTPIVVIAACLLAFAPPILISGQSLGEWIHRGLIFLVISCPCALVISVPLSFFGGIGGASKRGILIKGGNYLEVLSKIDTIVFDKTGTLTKGQFEVNEVYSKIVSKDKLLEYAAMAENYSNHPISTSIKRAYGKEINSQLISKAEDISGKGIKAIVGGKTIHIGNEKLMNSLNIDYEKYNEVGTIAYIAIDNKFAGYFVISDSIKETSRDGISKLKGLGISNTIMLTGDNKNVGESVATKVGLDRVYSELLPDGKVEKLEEIISQCSSCKVAFVGDGINDAPALTRADVGIAMGGLGSDAAIEAADVVIMDDDVSKIATGIQISKKTIAIAKQNIIFAIGVKVLILLLGALGIATMWEAVFADVGVAVIAILNSMRALNTKKIE